jgi:hypothetical protein
VAEALLAYPQLADLLGGTAPDHRQQMAERLYRPAHRPVPAPAVTVMNRIDFSPAALRRDLAGPRSAGLSGVPRHDLCHAPPGIVP